MRFDEIRCALSYTVLSGLAMSHNPPTSWCPSNPVKGTPCFCRARAVASPMGPAPITAYIDRLEERLAAHQDGHHRLLDMQPVLGFIPHAALRTVNDRRGDFLAAMRGQAM